MNEEIINENIEKRSGFRFNLLLLITLFTGVILIISTYAWFYASLDVKINFVKIKVTDETGLFISLDGITYSDSIEISEDIIINKLIETYPSHTSQWSKRGLYSVSSNGISSNNDNKFNVFSASAINYGDNYEYRHKVFTASKYEEKEINKYNEFIAFDIFLKNASGSPYSDNLFFDEGTGVVLNNRVTTENGSTLEVNTTSEEPDLSDGTFNSLRIGLLKLSTVNKRLPIEVIQGIECNNRCESIIYEPNALMHSLGSAERIKKRNIELIDGEYTPTYAVIKEGKNLEFTSGHIESGFILDEEHFALQNTIKDTDFGNRIFTLPNGVTKFRLYIWVEGQDLDNFESISKGANITVTINFEKDLAGYNT